MKTLKEYLDLIEGRRQMESDIEEIMETIDFEKIAKVMDFLGWTWVIRGRDADELVKQGYTVVFDDEYGDDMYAPKVKDIVLRARKIINDTIYNALESEERGEFTTHYMMDSGGFHCELDIVDDDVRKRHFGDDADDDFKHSVDITLKFVLEDYIGKFA